MPKRLFSLIVTVAFVALTLLGCHDTKKGGGLPVIKVDDVAEDVQVGDSTVYGECVDAAMNSVSILTSSGDTINYVFNNMDDDTDVQGGMFMGDKMAVIGFAGKEQNTAQKVINITSLLGRWISLDKNFEIKDGGVVESSVAAESNPYTSWKIFNGRLVLSKDTFDVLNLGPDSLLLENEKGIFAFKRQV